jgi:hypothetical protein
VEETVSPLSSVVNVRGTCPEGDLVSLTSLVICLEIALAAAVLSLRLPAVAQDENETDLTNREKLAAESGWPTGSSHRSLRKQLSDSG